MKKRRLLAIVMAMMMVVAFGMTSMAAASTSNTLNGIYGSLTTGTRQANGATTNKNNGTSYVSVKAHYTATSGDDYWSPKAEKSSNTKAVNASANVSGSVFGGESGHGEKKSSIMFNLSL